MTAKATAASVLFRGRNGRSEDRSRFVCAINASAMRRAARIFRTTVPRLAVAGGVTLGATSFFGGASVVKASPAPAPVKACPRAAGFYQQVYNEITAALEDLDYDDGSYGPVFLRLAWHAAGTYSQADGSGGSKNATMRFNPEASHGANAGLDVARARLESIKAKFGDRLSYADLWSLAGIVAIAEAGGPVIPWRAGRSDAPSGDHCTPDGRLPPGDAPSPTGCPYPTAGVASALRSTFHRMGLSDGEIVALAGAHVLGRCHTSRSGYDGAWTRAPTTFSNDYYTRLRDETWVPRVWDGPAQYTNAGAQDLMMLPADIAFLQDPVFRVYVDRYAGDQAAFFADFTAAYTKLGEQGVPAFTTPPLLFKSPAPATA